MDTPTETQASATAQVVTWQTPRGATLNVCLLCEDGMNALGRWWTAPATGEEFCQVSRGRHTGTCDICA